MNVDVQGHRVPITRERRRLRGPRVAGSVYVAAWLAGPGTAASAPAVGVAASPEG